MERKVQMNLWVPASVKELVDKHAQGKHGKAYFVETCIRHFVQQLKENQK